VPFIEIKSLTKTQQLKNFIKEALGKNEIKAGDSILSESELARKCKVSSVTVRRAIKELVKEGFLYSVQGKGTFVRDRNKSRSCTRIVSLLYPKKNESSLSWRTHFSEWTKYLGEELSLYDYQLSHYSLSSKGDISRILNKNFLSDGFILMNSIWNIQNELLKKNCHFVALIARIEDSRINSVVVNQYEGAYQATMYLIENGYKRIAVISGPQKSLGYHQRVKGYLAALEDKGIKKDRELIKIVSLGGEESGYQAMNSLLKLKRPPQAVFCLSDFKAIGAIEVAKGKGLKIPQDIAIMGFDDIEISKNLKPPLTTVRVPKDKIARAGIKLLMESIINPKFKPRHEVVKTELITRKST